MLCVPLVSTANTISSGDSTRLPKVPRIYENLTANPDLSVTIHSSAQDFRENYQIGGKINYEYLGGFDQYVGDDVFLLRDKYEIPLQSIFFDWKMSEKSKILAKNWEYFCLKKIIEIDFFLFHKNLGKVNFQS